MRSLVLARARTRATPPENRAEITIASLLPKMKIAKVSPSPNFSFLFFVSFFFFVSFRFYLSMYPIITCTYLARSLLRL
jgi:hypothetical protein